MRYVLSGSNIVTEAILPASWGYDANDLRYIKSIHKKFGRVRLKTFPQLSFFGQAYYTFVKGIKFIPILNYILYVKKDAIQFFKKELGWEDYGGKHYESIYTRFFQSYILPRKFNIDKRKAHLSSLICSGQITREEALKQMKQNIFPPIQLSKDKEYVLKKLNFTKKAFEKIMSQPLKGFKDYPSNYFLFNNSKIKFLVRLFCKVIDAIINLIR